MVASVPPEPGSRLPRKRSTSGPCPIVETRRRPGISLRELENPLKNLSSFRRIAVATGAASVLATSMVGGALAADNGTTSATVNAMISVAAPATFAFGAGVPGDTKSVLDSTVTVISNNDAGYTLSVQGSNLTKVGGTIAATALSFGISVENNTYAPLTAAATNLLLATTAAETDADGTDHLIDAQLVLPFVEDGNYAGTFIFTASNI